MKEYYVEDLFIQIFVSITFIVYLKFCVKKYESLNENVGVEINK